MLKKYSTQNKLEIITLDKPGITDFAEARNSLLEKSNAEWVFFIDSDEEVTPELIKEIGDAINKKQIPDKKRGPDAYYIKRKIFFLGKYVGEDKVLRLAKKGSGKWIRAVHEVWDIKSHPRGVLKNYIIHNTADNLREYIEKINKYSTIHAKENSKEGKKSNLFKIVFYPPLKFIQNILLGRGFVFSMLQSFHSFLSWSKEWIS
jgi:glycosyltransferase involved in cell wall biosynthesis